MISKILIVPNKRQGELWCEQNNDLTTQIATVNEWLAECYERFGSNHGLVLVDRDQFELKWGELSNRICSATGRDTSKFIKESVSALEDWKLWGHGKLEDASIDEDLITTYTAFLKNVGDWAIPYFDLFEWVLSRADYLATKYQISFFGFDAIPTALKKIEATFKHDNGWFESVNTHKDSKQAVSQIIYETEADEIAGIVEQVSLSVNRGEFLTVLIPNLKEKAKDIESELIEKVWPKNFWPTNRVSKLPIEMGVINFLSEYAIAKSFLFTIKMWFEPLELEDWMVLAGNPYLKGFTEEQVLREQMVHRIESWPRRELSAKDFLWLCEQHKCFVLKELLNTTETLIRLSKPAIEWAGYYENLVQNILFDSGAKWRVDEVKVLKQLEGIKKNIVKLGIWGRKLSGYEIWAFVKRAVGKSGIKMNDGEKCQVQFLDAKDGLGLSFDNVVLAECDYSKWIFKQRKQPMLSQEALKSWEHPTTQERALRERSTSNLKDIVKFSENPVTTCAKSYSRKNSNIATLPECVVHYADPAKDIDYLSSFTGTFHSLGFDDVVNAQQFGVLKRGQEWLNTHNECPTKAFIQHRLGAFPQREKFVGLEPHLFSLIIHKILELVWNKLVTKIAMLKLSQTELSDLADSMTKTAVEALEAENVMRVGDELVVASLPVIKQIILQHFAKQANRKEDFTVSETEKRVNIAIGDYELNCVMDRVDTVTNYEGKSGEIVADYKRYGFTVSDWTREGMRSLQLPIYFLNTDIELKGLAIEQVLANDYKISGVTGIPSLSGMRCLGEEEALKKFREKCKALVVNITNEIKQGNCKPNPLDKKLTCNDCQYKGICHLET